MAKPRQIRMEQRGATEAMSRLETLSDEELEAQTKFKSAAQAILGARAAERYDSKTARGHFQIRRMADASLALAERRPDDLKAAVERLGQTPPSGRQLLILRLMGLLAPPPGASPLLRVRGILIIILIIVGLLALGLGVVELVSLPFGGIGVGSALLLGLLVVVAVLAVLSLVGRRRQAGAKARARGAG
jgi:hypothetical protein